MISSASTVSIGSSTVSTLGALWCHEHRHEDIRRLDRLAVVAAHGITGVILSDELVDAVIGGVGILGGGLEVTALALILLLHVTIVIARLAVLAAHGITDLVLSGELGDSVIGGVGILRGGLEVTVLALVLLLHVNIIVASLTVVAAHGIMGLGLADELVDAIIGGVGILGGGLEVTVPVPVPSSMSPSSSPASVSSLPMGSRASSLAMNWWTP